MSEDGKSKSGEQAAMRASRPTLPLDLSELDALVEEAAGSDTTQRIDLGKLRSLVAESAPLPLSPQAEREAAGGEAIAVSAAEGGEDALEEFDAEGSSITEALTSLTDQHFAVGVGGPTVRPASEPKAAPIADRDEPRAASSLVSAVDRVSRARADGLQRRGLRDRSQTPTGLSGGDDFVLDRASMPTPDRLPVVSSSATPSRMSPAVGTKGGPLQAARRLEAVNEHKQALALCKEVLANDPAQAEALEMLERLQALAIAEAEARIGDLDAIPTIRLASSEIVWHKLDHRTGFVLSRVDGMLTYSDIITVSGMSRHDAVTTFVELLELGIIATG